MLVTILSGNDLSPVRRQAFIHINNVNNAS